MLVAPEGQRLAPCTAPHSLLDDMLNLLLLLSPAPQQACRHGGLHQPWAIVHSLTDRLLAEGHRIGSMPAVRAWLVVLLKPRWLRPSANSLWGC
jgi:hypothetical protein